MDLSALRADRALVSCLAEVHGEDALLAGPDGERLPALYRRLSMRDPDSLLGTLRADNRVFPDNSPELRALQASCPKLWNGPTYVLRGFEDDGERLSCAEGRYFDAVTTCFELRSELKRAVATWPGDPARAWQAMPRRRALLDGRAGGAANDWLWRGDGRSASLSISCLLVVAEHAGHCWGVARRADDVGDDPGLHHVVPSMAFQPQADAPAGGYSIRDRLLRELAEELFGLNEGADWRDLAPLRDLLGCLERGDARLRVTGLAMNLEDLRPEILTLLLVSDPDWLASYRDTMRLCRIEYAVGETGLAPLEPWRSSGLERSMPEAFRRGRGTVSGSACVALGGPVLAEWLNAGG